MLTLFSSIACLCLNPQLLQTSFIIALRIFKRVQLPFVVPFFLPATVYFTKTTRQPMLYVSKSDLVFLLSAGTPTTPSLQTAMRTLVRPILFWLSVWINYKKNLHTFYTILLSHLYPYRVCRTNQISYQFRILFFSKKVSTVFVSPLYSKQLMHL